MNKILRYVILVGLFLVPFVPLIVVNSFFFPYITGKNFAFRILIEIILGAWVILAVNDARFRPRRTWLFWALTAFIAVMFVADCFSVYPFKSFWSNFERMEGYITLLHLAALFVIASTVLWTEKLWNWFWNTSIGVSLIVVIYSLLQLAGKIPVSQSANRLDATFGNSTYLAIYALFHVFIVAYLMINDNLFIGIPLVNGRDSKIMKTIVGFVIIILEVVVIYYTETRGALLGLIGGVALSALLIIIFEQSRTLIRRAAIIALVAACVVVLGFLIIKNTSFVKNSSTLNRFATISLTDKTTESRFILWHMAWKGVTENPKTFLVGWGQESFNYIFNKYYDPRLYDQEQWFDRTHNVIFDWLVAGGILGLATYLWFFGAIIWYIWRKTTMSVSEKSVLTGMLAGYFVHNLFVFDNITSYLIFFLLAAYVQTKSTAIPENTALLPEPQTDYTNRIILPVSIIVTILVIYMVNYKAYMTNVTLIQAITPQAQSQAATLGLANNAPYGGDVTKNISFFQKALAYNSYGTPEVREQLFAMADSIVSSNTPTPVTDSNDLLALAVNQAQAQVDATPNDARYQVLGGVLFNRMNRYDDALTYLTKASELSPKKQSILFELGAAYMGKQQFAQAETIYKRAYELDTSYEDAGLYYAISALYSGDQATANKILASLSPDEVIHSDQLMYVYYELKQYPKMVQLWKARVAEASDPNTHTDLATQAQDHVSLAAAYILVKDNADAIAEINKAIQIYPAFKDQGQQYIQQIKSGTLQP